MAVLKASGNRLLEVIAAPVFSVLRTRFMRDRASGDFWKTVTSDHHDIYDAIAAQDPAAAAQRMHGHLERLRPMYERTDRAARAARSGRAARPDPAT